MTLEAVLVRVVDDKGVPLSTQYRVSSFGWISGFCRDTGKFESRARANVKATRKGLAVGIEIRSLQRIRLTTARMDPVKLRDGDEVHLTVTLDNAFDDSDEELKEAK